MAEIPNCSDADISHIFTQIRSIYINDFKSEKSIFEISTPNELQYAVTLGGNTVRQLVKQKHYNENCPNNYNLALKHKKGDVAQVFNGNKFVDTPIEELLNYLILTAQDEITAILQLPDIKVTYVKQRYINKFNTQVFCKLF